MPKAEEGLGLLIGIGKPKKKGESMPDEGDDEAKELAAKGLIKALKSEDPARVAAAFEEMIAACDDAYGPGDEDDEEDEGEEDAAEE